MIHVIATIEAAPGKRDALLAEFRRNVPLVRAEAGCIEYGPTVDMKADLPLHSTGVLFLHTGANNAGRPSLGSWVTYGLGSENRNLPGFVVLNFDTVPCGGLGRFSRST